MPSFQTDLLILNGALVSATGGVIYVGGTPVFAGSGVSQLQLDTLSGNLTNTGSALFARDGSISGALATLLTLTGQTVQGNVIAASGNLASTGQTLYGNVVAASGSLANTGQTLYGYVTTTSGAVATTGTALYNDIIGLSGTSAPALAGYVYTTGGQTISGPKIFTSILGLNSGIKTPAKYFGSANYTLASGDYIVIATGAVASVTGILPAITVTDYSGILFTIINGRTTSLPISGIIGPDINPVIGQYDAIQVYGGSGVWHYIRQTGLPIWTDANNNGINLSGALAQTGATLITRDANISGAIATLLTTTGQTLLGNIVATSGSLASTGQVLYGNVLAVSGSLATTGQNLYAYITATSGFATGASGSLDTRLTSTGLQIGAISGALATLLTATGQTVQGNVIAASGNLALTGQVLYSNVVATSGSLANTGQTLYGNIVATSGSLASTGLALYNYVLGLSGTAAPALAGYVYTTGVQTISGPKTFTNVVALNSGVTSSVHIVGLANYTFTSGDYMVLFTGSPASVTGILPSATAYSGTFFTLLNGTTSALQISGIIGPDTNPLLYQYDALEVYATSGQWNYVQRTGSPLTATVTALSGYVGTVSGAIAVLLTQTGLQIGSISGALATLLTLTGQTLYGNVVATSGSLANTGQTLYGNIVATSGSLASTGQTLYNNIVATSGSLASTGQALYNYITATSGFATGASGFLSTSLTSTGLQIGVISGALDTRLTNTGTLLSAVKVSGSAIVPVADFTGIGSVSVVYSGGKIFVSGAASAAGSTADALNISGQLALTGTLLSAVKVSGSSIINNANFTGIGTVSVVWSGGTIFVSGAAGAAGSAADALNISGQLALTGTQLSAVKVSGSSVINTANFTGYGTTMVFWSGGTIFVSGAPTAAGGSQADSINLSGQLALTGTNLYNMLTGASGWLLAQPQVNLASGTGLLLNTVYYDNLTGVRILTISGTPLDSNFVTLYLNVTGLATLGFPTGYRLGSQGFTTGLNLSSGFHAVSFTRSNGRWVIDDTTSPLSALDVRAPTALDNITGGYDIGSRWVNTTNNFLYECTSSAAGAAVWSLLNNFSGFTNSVNRQIIFNSGNLGLYGHPNLTWDQTTYPTGALNIGNGLILINNPLAIAGSGNTYIQVNIQNQSSGTSAQSDYVLTADVGNDTNNFVDLGINNSKFADTGYNLYKPLDGFLYNRGGDMHLGAAAPGNVVKFHTAGIGSGHLRVTIGDTGILMPSTGTISFASGLSIQGNALLVNSGQLHFSGIASNPIAAMFASGWGNTFYGPAMHARRIKYIGPQITTAQQLWGDTAANIGTLTTPTNDIYGEQTLCTPTAGLSCGTSFTTATTFRGTTSGIGNGFFFVCKFNVTGGTGMLTAPVGYPLEGGGYSYPSGSRLFVGLTSNAVDTQTNLHEPAGNYVGLRYAWASGGSVSTGQYMTNWAIGARDGTNAFTGNLAMEFKTGFYRFAMFCPPFPNNNIVYYQLDDMFRGSGIKGQVTSNLPAGGTALRGLVAKGFISGLAPLGTSVVYVETPNSTAIG